MSQIRHREAVEGLIRWMDGTIDAAKAGDSVIRIGHVMTWRDALRQVIGDIATREKAVITAESKAEDRRAGDMVEALVAEKAVHQVTSAVKSLAVLAQNGAPRSVYGEIDVLACLILDALHLLACGVVRPNSTTERGA